MTELGCNVASCSHNTEDKCCLNAIEVKGTLAHNCSDTCCSSFYEDRSGAKNATQSPNFDLSISCLATDCVYNEDKKCDANHVDISGICATNADDTVCATFQHR